MRRRAVLRLAMAPMSVILILLALGTLLVLQRTSLRTASQEFDDGLLSQEQYQRLYQENTVASGSYTALLVYDPEDEESVLVYENVAFVLAAMNVEVQGELVQTGAALEVDTAEQELATYAENRFSINETITDLIICSNNLAALKGMVAEIASFVEEGGHLLMAAGLYLDDELFAQDEDERELWLGLLGIDAMQAVGEEEIRSLTFRTSLLPGVEEMSFSDDMVTGTMLSCTVTENVTVYATDTETEDTPVLWSLDYGEGRVAVCNADLMDAKSDRGVICALFGELYEAFVWPVINAAVYCIDDFPSPSPAGYEENVLEQYGYTVADFLSNVWLPSMLQIAETYEIPYSAFVIQTYDDNVEGPFDDETNRTDAILYATEILKHGGEIGIHGYNHQPLTLDGFVFDQENSGYVFWHTLQDMLDSVRGVLDYANSIVGDATVQAYVAPSNVISKEALEELLTQVEDLRVYAGIYIGTEDQFVQEYSVLENGVVYFPRLTADMQMEDSEWWLQVNELAFHYVESNFIHPDDILDEERSDGGDFSQMLSGYETMVAWNTAMGLRAATISQGAAAVQRYSLLSVSQTLTESGLSLWVSGFVDEAYLMLRTDGRIPQKVEGAVTTYVDGTVWILQVLQEEIEITWEEDAYA